MKFGCILVLLLLPSSIDAAAAIASLHQSTVAHILLVLRRPPCRTVHCRWHPQIYKQMPINQPTFTVLYVMMPALLLLNKAAAAFIPSSIQAIILLPPKLILILCRRSSSSNSILIKGSYLYTHAIPTHFFFFFFLFPFTSVPGDVCCCSAVQKQQEPAASTSCTHIKTAA